MNKFKELINSLKAYTVVIIENEFTLINDSMKLLAFYCLCEQNISERINQNLIEKGFDEIIQLFKNFRISFLDVDHDEELINQIPALDNFGHYLEKIGESKILKDFNLTRFNEILETDEHNYIRSTFLKFGALNTYPENQYNGIIEEIKLINNTEILFFNQVPAVNEHENFIKTIQESITITKSNFYLCLIDKSLGNGQDSAGRDFAINDLKKLNNDYAINSISFIYTSRPSIGENNLEKLEDYYVQEIVKSSPPNFDGITKILAQSAYATVFDNISNNFVDSAYETLETVLFNQKNIKYIVDKSHDEGISPYDSIKYWFNLLLQKYFEDNEIENYSYVATLSSFFRNEFLDDHQNMSDIDEDVRDLNTYELFDYKVNDKLLPIAPGDIWYSNGDYYILMGQLCDMLIRKGDSTGNLNTRNGKLGELLKLNLINYDSKKDKYYIDFDNKKKYVYIQNFKDIYDELKSLKIDVSTPNINYAELRVLDLCMFNLDGKCKLNIEKELEPKIINMLYENKNIYFESLQKRYKYLGFNNLAQIINVLDEGNPVKFGTTGFVFENNIVDYRLKRIARLKGRYYDSLYNNFINNKGRVDLNLIDNYAVKSQKIKLKCQISNFTETIEEIEIDIYSHKEEKYLLKEDLLNKLSANYSDLISLIDGQINPYDKNHFSFIDEDNYELSFLLKFEGKSIDKTLDTIDYRKFFKTNHSRYKALHYNIVGKPKKLISFDGNSISIEDLKIGIEIPETKERIILNRGIIKINSTE
jgi:hypothetical protein